MVFRAIQELLGNIALHSQATQVIIQMDSSETGLRVSIEDNGKGFDVEKAQEKGGMGLKVIRDRVQMLGGNCGDTQYSWPWCTYFISDTLHKCGPLCISVRKY
jgi:signal transduction histidine kinase